MFCCNDLCGVAIIWLEIRERREHLCVFRCDFLVRLAWGRAWDMAWEARRVGREHGHTGALLRRVGAVTRSIPRSTIHRLGSSLCRGAVSLSPRQVSRFFAPKAKNSLPASTGFVLRSDPCRRVPRSGLAGPESRPRVPAAASLSQNVGSRGGC